MHLDALFVNGRIRTLDPERPTASRVGVLDGVVVGLDEELDGCTAASEHDLGGAHVVPGLHDAHYHVSAEGQELQQLRLDGTTSADEVYDAVAGWVANPDRADDEWVLGQGLNDGVTSPLDRDRLDAAAQGRPVWLTHVSHHAGMANTAALRRMGFDDPRDVPDVSGGVVRRDAGGAATGWLAERALGLVTTVLRPRPFETYVDAIARGTAAAAAKGLTSVTEPGIGGQLTGNGPRDLAAFQQARELGLLSTRVTVMPEMTALRPLEEQMRGLDLGIRTGFGDDWLRVGAVKLFSDGALTAHTAALCQAYDGDEDERGLLVEEAEELIEKIVTAHAAGWQVAVHAIGDRAVDTVLDGIEQAQARHPRTDPRHRIEHCGMADDARIDRLRRLGVIPVPQGEFVVMAGKHYAKAVGEDRVHLLYRQRGFVDAGLEIPGSSDCPVATGDPIFGIYSAVNRRWVTAGGEDTRERLSVEQALRAYTYGSAYADRQEHRKGRLRRGMLGDLVVLTDDLLAVPPQDIQQVGVRATVVGGRVVHDDGTLS